MGGAANGVFRDTVRLVERLEVGVVNVFSGNPDDGPQARPPNWVTCTWPPRYGKILPNGICVVCGQIGNIHRSTSWPELRARTIELARSGTVRLDDLPRLTVPVERAAAASLALTRPAEVLQVALEYATGTGVADG